MDKLDDKISRDLSIALNTISALISRLNNRLTNHERKINTMSIGKVIKKYKLNEQPNDLTFWQSKSYEERLDALEQIRREYNSWRYNAEQGFQRVYRIIKRT